MKIAATVAEYNPFHLGHEYMLKSVKSLGFDGVIAVMSGNFVQRGDCAVCDKRARAKAALQNGADLVVELPVPFATASAERFAYGAAEIIKGMGCVDAIAFGSESGDARIIEKAAKIISGDLSEAIKPYLSEGMTFAAARQKAVESIEKEAAELLQNPNDTLAVEYVSHLLGSGIKPIAIKRIGAAHDGEVKNGFASASEIRKMIISGDRNEFKKYMPKSAAEIINEKIEKGLAPADLKSVEGAVLSTLRQMTAEDIAKLPDISEGLENRIISAVRGNTSLDEILEEIKTKRYTLARIRRTLLCAYLGITKDYVFGKVPYIRVIGFNQKGREIMNVMKKTATLPIVSRAKEINALDKRAQDMFILESRTTDLYWLMTPTKMPCGKEMTDSVIII